MKNTILLLSVIFTVFPLGCGQEISRPSTEKPNSFFEDFSSTPLNENRWLVDERSRGGEINNGYSYNGGVLAKNVEVKDGYVYLHAYGNQYTGPIRGKNKDGSLRFDGKRTGATLVTKTYFASGRYEVRMKIIPVLGVVSTMWTFYYKEFYPGDPEYVNKPVGGADYWANNQEIDIELPGRPAAPAAGIGFDRALFNSWIGENDDEYTVGYTSLSPRVDDGQFHVFRFDWYTGGPGIPARVEMYIDNVWQATNTTHVPTVAGRLWIGPWFARNWAGTPNFDHEIMVIDWVRITPFWNPNDQFIKESDSTGGFGSLSEVQY